MENPIVFTCLQCDAEMEIAAPIAQDQVACRSCGRLYLLFFDDRSQAWLLRAQEPAVRAEEELRTEEPFRVLDEVGRPKKVDRSEKHREQTDLHTDEDIALAKPKRKS